MRTNYDKTAVQRAAIRTVAASLAHGILFGFGYLPSRHRPRRARDIRTIVFVHGLAGNRANFFPMQAWLRLHGHDRQYSFNYHSTGSIEALALNLKRHLDENVRGGRIALIGHSMGGLIARAYLQLLGGSRRVDRLITLATPHRGTTSACYVPTPLLSQLEPGAPFLRHLDGLEPPQGVEVHSFAAGRDLVVLPQGSAFAPFGETVLYEDLGHLDLLLSPSVFAAVHRRLAINRMTSSAP